MYLQQQQHGLTYQNKLVLPIHVPINDMLTEYLNRAAVNTIALSIIFYLFVFLFVL